MPTPLFKDFAALNMDSPEKWKSFPTESGFNVTALVIGNYDLPPTHKNCACGVMFNLDPQHPQRALVTGCGHISCLACLCSLAELHQKNVKEYCLQCHVKQQKRIANPTPKLVERNPRSNAAVKARDSDEMQIDSGMTEDQSSMSHTGSLSTKDTTPNDPDETDEDLPPISQRIPAHFTQADIEAAEILTMMASGGPHQQSNEVGGMKTPVRKRRATASTRSPPSVKITRAKSVKATEQFENFGTREKSPRASAKIAASRITAQYQPGPFDEDQAGTSTVPSKWVTLKCPPSFLQKLND